MTPLPLLRHDNPDRIMAWRRGRAITVRHFLAEVATVAAALRAVGPADGPVLNLCADRYRFTVGLAAALCQGRISLLPPNDTPALLRRLAAQHPGLAALTDGKAAPPPIPRIAYPETITHPAAAEAPAFPADQIAAIAFTSGSTGDPMPQVKSWGSLVGSTLGAGAALGIAGGEAVTLLGTVPQQHMYGLESTVLLALQHGIAMHAGRPFYPGDIAAALAELPGPRLLVTTPIHLRALLADPSGLPKLDFVLSATAPLAPQTAAAAEAAFGAPLHEIYGCAEAGQIATRRPVAGEAWQCLPGITLRQDEHGTWAQGDFLAKDALLADIIDLRAPDRFLLHGRLADLVNIAGKRTSLAHLNFQLNSIPGVLDGVFVMPEEVPDGVTRLTAFVVAPGLTAEAILAALRSRVDRPFLPRPLRLVDALPRNATGKLPREAALELIARSAAAGG
ncbi:MAG TPA: AMP-binding protein [Stellaceae bacterium]|nr:AMP-binding protein [Stellaceae bacterium]